MTKEVLQQALEALEYASTGNRRPEIIGPAITALRARLEQPEQEPVAWIQPDHLQKARRAPFLCRVEPTKRMSDFVPLYTTPPAAQRKPLTDEVIHKLWGNTYDDTTDRAAFEVFARAIEAAHGIKEQP